MIKKSIISIFVFTLCITVLITASYAANNDEILTIENIELSAEIEEHIDIVKQLNMSLAKNNINDIPCTISLTKPIDISTLADFALQNNITVVQIEARGIDSKGDKITFMSKVHRGYEETEKILLDMAKDENITFIGFNAIYALIDSKDLLKTQNNDLSFLVDTSSFKENTSKTNNYKFKFAHSLAWELN